MIKNKLLTWRIIIVGLFVLISIPIVYSVSFTTKEVVAAKKGFTTESFVHDGLSFQLSNSEHEETTHTFYFNVKNFSNEPKRIWISSFEIVNGKKRFKPSTETFSQGKLNPGIEGTVTVTFDMNMEDLTTGEPKVQIRRGVIFTEYIILELLNND